MCLNVSNIVNGDVPFTCYVRVLMQSDMLLIDRELHKTLIKHPG